MPEALPSAEQSPATEHPYRTSRKLLIGTVLVCAVLVATHLGEFWPFSIYPMFSQGGRPWSRSVVRDITDADAAVSWETATVFEALPGAPLPLGPTGINQNDIANFVSKSRSWNAAQVANMRKVFGRHLQGRRLLIYRVEGRISEADAVALAFVPFMVLAADSVRFNPRLNLTTDITPSTD